jgi:HEPN domain-containing protein
MSEHDIVAEWLQAAYDDYDSAKYLFDRPYKKALEIICYHCQQAAEKSLKAFLVANDIAIAKTHDTGILYRKCVEIEGTFSKFEKTCEEFTIYATRTRYPIRIEVDEETAERLLQQAQEIYNFVFALVKPSDEALTKS